MSTVTAAKGLAANPQVNPRVFVGSIADGFQKVRPKSFAASLLGEGQLETGLLAFTAMLNCGSVSAGAHPHRETLRVIAIQGASDAYPLQWAKPLLPAAKSPKAHLAQWHGQLKNLLPTRICDQAPGEAAPYLSCRLERQVKNAENKRPEPSRVPAF